MRETLTFLIEAEEKTFTFIIVLHTQIECITCITPDLETIRTLTIEIEINTQK